MASVKEIFKLGLSFTYTTIVNLEEDLQETVEAIEYAPAGKYKRLLQQKQIDLKKQIDLQKKILKNDIEYFGYTEEDLKGKFKPVRLTQEELDKDWEKVMAEASGDPNLSPEIAQAIAGE